MHDFHPLEVVGRGSETQPKVGGNVNYLAQRFHGYVLIKSLIAVVPSAKRVISAFYKHVLSFLFYARIYATRSLNPLTAKLFNLNFHSLEILPRWRDLQVSENY